ncbi:hypothetical protein WQE_04922 [Paraburkholderia hospita]|uniref:Tail fiber protein n=1 Tax=Paraburkholderia hospita TaxID=169430 RepID=A0ABN0FU80_9BURK|nr:hypothetical protein [Paraburkholderia hospita]EIN02303.1 hypothetical protein WQE_04922 [Paraburkholderia hospita]OUL72637.1 hypothetical protein CA602_42905 [Paraburkholderia hospita]
MYRIDDATAGTSLPTPETAATEGYWIEGNPATGTPATKIRASWLNMIQEELCAILAAAGIARSKTTYNQVNSALQKLYSPVIGSARNVAMSVTAASATATLTADEIVVGTALGGQKYMLSSFNKPINLATTGAGGMDTGTAPTSGYVALYAIYNPTTGTSALLATNATSVVQPNVYGGANMPSGYTASALVSVWPTNASKLFAVGLQMDRLFANTAVTALSTSTVQTSPAALSIASSVPPNARTVSGQLNATSTTNSGLQLAVFSNAAQVGGQGVNTGSTGANVIFRDLMLATPQTLFWTSQSTAGTPSFSVVIWYYTI